MSKKNLKSKELTDEELGKVAGGAKDLDEDDITSGQLFHCWDDGTSVCFWVVYSVSGETATYSELVFNKANPSSYKETVSYYASKSTMVSRLNEMDAYKVDRLPQGYYVYE